jgi:hypothetical protein
LFIQHIKPKLHFLQSIQNTNKTMAPNLKHSSLLLQKIPNLQVVRVKDYQPSQEAVVDSASYWEWPSQSDKTEDVLSTDHLVSNLLEAPPVEGKSTTNASSDDYWAEAEQDTVEEQSEVSKPQQEEISSADYWAEAAHEPSSSDDYWNTNAVVPPLPKDPVTTVRNTSVNPSVSAAYWQEATHKPATATRNSDDYWAESRPSQSSDGDYWAEATFAQTDSDKYWSWSAIRA